jgi:1-deoxy-D-xylulose-5-phosphate synthase
MTDLSPEDNLLAGIDSPADLKNLPAEQLPALAADIRRLIIRTVSKTGGHLASNLGSVELTLALHRVFDSPRDKIIWDVGHQCYTHKIVTGRKAAFPRLRQLGGLSGFPKRSESVHDIVDTGHSSTSISAALGILIGQAESTTKVVAVIGDGALTAGLALEGLNQAGHLARNLIIVLNDNAMSIGRNVGALSAYLSRLTTTRPYQFAKDKADSVLPRLPLLGPPILRLLRRLERGFKALVLRETLFADFGFEYVGPIDGHNIPSLIRVFKSARAMERPVVIHVKTVKGKGYAPAEQNPTRYHGVAPPGSSQGKLEEAQPARTYTEAFSRIAMKLGAERDDLRVITAAMADGTGLSLFQQHYPDRFFDVGITEQHALTFAAGLALAGARPLVAIYSTFMQRAVDQVIHDIALPSLPVVMALDRAGLAPRDGETHHGVFDVSLFRSIPNLTILCPASALEMEKMFRYAFERSSPVMVRYPKALCGPELENLSRPLKEGCSVPVLEGGGEVLLLSLGGILPEVLAAADLLREGGIGADVSNLRFAAPIAASSLQALAAPYRRVVVVEEGVVAGGAGSAVCRLLEGCCAVDTLGIPDCFVPQGSRQELLELCGLSAPRIAAAVAGQIRIRPLSIHRHKG